MLVVVSWDRGIVGEGVRNRGDRRQMLQCRNVMQGPV